MSTYATLAGTRDQRAHVALGLAMRRLLRWRIHREVLFEVAAAIGADAAAVGDWPIHGGKERGLLHRGDRSR